MLAVGNALVSAQCGVLVVVVHWPIRRRTGRCGGGGMALRGSCADDEHVHLVLFIFGGRAGFGCNGLARLLARYACLWKNTAHEHEHTLSCTSHALLLSPPPPPSLSRWLPSAPRPSAEWHFHTLHHDAKDERSAKHIHTPMCCLHGVRMVWSWYGHGGTRRHWHCRRC